MINDAAAICVLAHCYYTGLNGVQQDDVKAMELYARAADLGYSKAHYNLANIYGGGGALRRPSSTMSRLYGRKCSSKMQHWNNRGTV